ncbi:MAG: tRNA (adenosine(37)-N6)-threonylcarbamoyltransferase complex transferase subunit TsaD [Candidatus Yanofskybacteria bacterium RIFCSPHIGHO2_01_FULL_45_42]|uniref:tRNA N6-adenosine threonylcarbamoyltransferase n=3 Tax=Candidatus Yanofskyibacteriota TaxID=1752733 RepID=A0A1F8H2L2_9BACT|nr:MAG: tRNA (adenosine(37)-N6)-threonylcarbamoyltransferase complex transferase subunit TsaD [Candidatus Yanofskybacteria bacterium RIFCSPHIGHO2_01_FULL_45_42]OGN15503.1 MAG: tRNA (adenosine(37)-N6)-threonylcarbamoyltransferase complex transferase subunit TsaD [Candidatus Yanofskybacteria bacterium RIFCSPHIGHO2_02_FULL_46_19]OGN27210.1 MAG: tRNA (adenosine(37)-N6)-threonylcarbamoyltransferase complex transferase subunit TsaD [Candidatus Yanofskybacteria bacterium RIFCSPLOWO2_01_FULL_45_72]OGN31
MKILGIETSCDETAIAIIEAKSSRIEVLSNAISSQVKLHAKFGGVVPNLAAREHAKNIGHVFKTALADAETDIDGIGLISVTRGPGLAPALLTGLTFARTLAWKYDKPIVGVNHLDGHIHSNWLMPIGVKTQNSKLKIQNFGDKIFPALNLIVSGGHTELVLMQDHGKYKIIGETLDDAVGEAFDKVARLLGLGYPGGPQIARLAEQFALNNAGSIRINADTIIKFPRPMIKSKDFNFSYSGLKTSVLYKVRELKENKTKLTDSVVNEICYEFQKAAIEVLVQKTLKAAAQFKTKAVLLSGGVSANKYLREELSKNCAKAGIRYFQPAMEYTGDNATMIACAGYFRYAQIPTTSRNKFSWKSIKMDANLSLS